MCKLKSLETWHDGPMHDYAREQRIRSLKLSNFDTHMTSGTRLQDLHAEPLLEDVMAKLTDDKMLTRLAP